MGLSFISQGGDCDVVLWERQGIGIRKKLEGLGQEGRQVDWQGGGAATIQIQYSFVGEVCKSYNYLVPQKMDWPCKKTRIL